MKIYFMQQGTDGAIKIGFSRNVKDRLRKINESTPYQVRLLGQVDGTYGDEGKLHKKFQSYRIKGEWYLPGDELIDYIRNLPNNNVVGTFPAGVVAKIKMEAMKDWFSEKAKGKGVNYERRFLHGE